MIELGRGMLFPDSWADGPPDPPPDVSCPECGEDMNVAGSCWHCGFRFDNEED